MKVKKVLALAGCVVGVGCAGPDGAPVQPGTTAVQTQSITAPKAQHVLLLSIDGWHQTDIDLYVAGHPASALADLNSRGLGFTQTTSSRPSDSFPGTLAMVTGAQPRHTGIFYDVTWDDNLSPPGSACATRGTVVPYNETVSVNKNDVNTVLDPNKLPLNPDNGCTPVYPHQYLKVNTIYEVIHAAGLRTAASDKHASYDLLNGPSGTGLDDLYTPEINPAKNSISLTEANDELKVQATINQIDGYDHTRTNVVGVPAILGMNFQAANIAHKIAGYADGAGNPTPGLAQAFDYVDGAIGRIMAEVRAQGLLDSTLVIVTAKSGNSPIDPTLRRAVDPALYTSIINGAVGAGMVANVTADTVALIWLKDHSKAIAAGAAVQANAAALGVDTVYAGSTPCASSVNCPRVTAAFAGAFNYAQSRRPDVIVQPVHGVVYTTATKLADHGGFTDDDIHVPLLFSQPSLIPGTVTTAVDLRQVAPTILTTLGLDPQNLQAVTLEGVSNLVLNYQP